ncbi:uncharacterized protein LOC141654907 [Silene latifolia]|uniref:uncharacterized protein LOC141654907 n=1 Tax=Silene latifolia TaxID=37657 RepID=UPI003D7758F0
MMVTTATGASKEACMCKGFGSTLTGATLQWFVGLPNGTISSFADLVNAFNQQFSSSRRTPKQPSDLYRIVQEIGESIKDYVTRFNAEKVSIRGCDMSTAINAFRHDLDKESNLYKELTMYPCERFEEVQQRATAALRLEEDIQARKGIASFDKSSRKFATEKKDNRTKPYSRPNISRIAEKTQQIDDSPHPPKLSEYGFNTGMEGLLKALRSLGDQVRWPKPPTQDRPNDDRDSSKRCEWHQDIGHRTEDCYRLRKEVKFQDIRALYPPFSTKCSRSSLKI